MEGEESGFFFRDCAVGHGCGSILVLVRGLRIRVTELS